MSTIKNSSVSAQKGVKTISFNSINVSKLPGMVEDKNYEWVFEVEDQKHKVTLRHDMKTGEVEGCLDGYPFVKRRVPPNDIFYSYFYDFQIDGHFFDIMHTPQACYLNIDDVSFTYLYNRYHSENERKPTFMSVVRNNLQRSGEGTEFTNVGGARQQQYMPPGVGMGQYGVMMNGSMQNMHYTRGMMKQEIQRQVEPVMTSAVPYGNSPYGQPQMPQMIPQQKPQMPQMPPPMRQQPPSISPPSQKPLAHTDLNVPLYDPKGSLVGEANSPTLAQNAQWKVEPPSLSGNLFSNPELNALALAFAAFYFGPPKDQKSQPSGQKQIIPQNGSYPINQNPPQMPPPMTPYGLPQGPPRTTQEIPATPFVPPMPGTNRPSTAGGYPTKQPLPIPQQYQQPPINRMPPLPNKPQAKEQKVVSAQQLPSVLPVMQASYIQSQRDIRKIESHLIDYPLVSGSIKTLKSI